MVQASTSWWTEIFPCACSRSAGYSAPRAPPTDHPTIHKGGEAMSSSDAKARLQARLAERNGGERNGSASTAGSGSVDPREAAHKRGEAAQRVEQKSEALASSASEFAALASELDGSSKKSGGWW